jgi:hypothetical protein
MHNPGAGNAGTTVDVKAVGDGQRIVIAILHKAASLAKLPGHLARRVSVQRDGDGCG